MFNYLHSKKNKFLDWFVYTFSNPYLVNPQGVAPVQAEGVLSDGNCYYFRARGRQWYLKVSNSKDTFDFDKEIFHFGDRNYKEWPKCSWLSRRECIKLATRALDVYFNRYV